MGLLPEAPPASAYGAPTIDFSPLGNLFKSYFQGNQMGREMAMQRDLANAAATANSDPSGNPDFKAYVRALAPYDPRMAAEIAQSGMQIGAGADLDRIIGGGAPAAGGVPRPSAGGAGGAPSPSSPSPVQVQSGGSGAAAAGTGSPDLIMGRYTIDQAKDLADKLRQQAARLAANPALARSAQMWEQNANRLDEEIAKRATVPSFHQIGMDANGFQQFGFVNPGTQTVTAVRTQGGSSVAGAPGTDLTGDAFLSTLEPGRAAQIKAIVEGRMNPPSGYALKAPQMQALIRDAAQYEPGFDFTKWQQRAATAKDFASGKAAANVTSLNTTVGHLEGLMKAADALNNVRIPAVNSVTNWIADNTGDERISNFNLNRNAVSDELAKVFRQTGMSDREIRQWKENFSINFSPEQFKGAIKTAIELLESRLNSLSEQRNRGMSTQLQPEEILSPKAQKALQSVRDWANGGTGKIEDTGASQRAPAAAQQQTGDALSQAKAAIAKGAPRDAVIQRLRQMGVDPAGL